MCGEGTVLKIVEVTYLWRKLVKDQDKGVSSGKLRLMLVKFGMKESATSLFQMRFGLKDAGFPNVYVNLDLSKGERELKHRLGVELWKGNDKAYFGDKWP